MIVVISPAKTLNFSRQVNIKEEKQPQFTEEAMQLIEVMKGYSPSKIAALMNISPDLAHLNYVRYHTWSDSVHHDTSKQAIAAFDGEAYRGLDVKSFTEEDLRYAGSVLRIFSGLYGLLHPFDMIHPYRLDMGLSIKGKTWNNLYAFWGDKLAFALNAAVEESGSHFVINLASAEYFKSVSGCLSYPVITPVFKEESGAGYRVVASYAKRARGLMTRFVIQNRINEPEELKAFDLEGYRFNPHWSDDNEWIFTRER